MRQDGDLFFSNIEEVFSPDPVTGAIAAKLAAIAPRALFYDATWAVVHQDCPQLFKSYVEALLGASVPHLFVPSGTDPQRQQLVGTFEDPQLTELVKGRLVRSYMPSPRLGALIVQHGGEYPVSSPKAIAVANDKAGFRTLARNVPDIYWPDGGPITSIEAIVDEVYRRLQDRKSVFVRHTQGGGGLGNAAFHPNEQLTKEAIWHRLVGSQDRFWARATALVEEHLPPLRHAFGIDVLDEGDRYPYRQILVDHCSVGRWIGRVPGLEVDWLFNASQTVAASLRRIEYGDRFGLDAGTLQDGRCVLFELNGRWTGGMYGHRMLQRLCGKDYLDRGWTGLVLDDFRLRGKFNFGDVYAALNLKGLLAIDGSVEGRVVIGIPPHGKSVGLTFIGKDPARIVATFDAVNDLIGDRERNTFDQPLLPAM